MVGFEWFIFVHLISTFVNLECSWQEIVTISVRQNIFLEENFILSQKQWFLLFPLCSHCCACIQPSPVPCGQNSHLQSYLPSVFLKASLGGIFPSCHWVSMARSYLLQASRISKTCSSQQYDIPSWCLGRWNLSLGPELPI